LRARTGSGKTAAFAIPIIQKILNLKNSTSEQKISAVILAPSKELCHQIKKVIDELTIKCSKIIKCLDLATKCKPASQKNILLQKPDIIISTPARILNHMNDKSIDVKSSLEILVVDEADLMLAFGFEEDVKNILKNHLPSTYQSVLASATLGDDVMELKKIVLHNAIVLKLEEPELPPIAQLSHYHIPSEEKEKAAILFTLFKLHLIKGKSLIFVNTVDKCYK
jgi:ATP-dependent RNA helicase DDX56/DBP9